MSLVSTVVSRRQPDAASHNRHLAPAFEGTSEPRGMRPNDVTFPAGRFAMHKTRTSPAARALTAVGVMLALAACTTPTDPAHVATVIVQPPLDSVEVGGVSGGFTVALKDAGGSDVTGRTVTWSSANTSIATVDAQGVVHGVSVGQVLITAASDGKSATATVKVLVPVASILMVPDSIGIRLTTQQRITAQLVGPGGEAISGRVVAWASANPSIATVDNTGLVTPVALGSTTVSASAGTQTGVTKILVKSEPALLAKIFPNAPVQIVRLGQTRQLTAACYNAFGNEIPGFGIDWSSTSPTVATVDQSGLVAGIALGQANIVANCNGPTASVVMQVTLVPVSTATINSSGLTVLVGQHAQLSVTAKDSAGNVLSLAGRTFVWSSDNGPLATVDQQGIVTGVSAGVANVQVAFPNDGVTTRRALRSRSRTSRSPW